MTVWTRQTILRRASAADIPMIMEMERRPGYDLFVGRWDDAQHLRNISKSGYLYLVHDGSEGLPIAFAALSGLGHRDGDVLINRMIVRTPGTGTGKLFLRAIMSLAFEGAPTYRLWLRVLPDNLRALHVYRTQGFRDERVVPNGGVRSDGVRVDLLLMSILREDWDARTDALEF
ncbi:MAG: acetyltransferase family protein [Rhizobium sp.]|nr:acetyltransferase family protein [Rhizobium sp.]